MSTEQKQSALDRLEKWCRKHYQFTIGCGGFVMPGDENWVQLKGGNREVYVDYYEPEFKCFDEDGEPDHPYATIEQLVNLALDRWESCTKPKQFNCCCHNVPNEFADKITQVPGYVSTWYSAVRDKISRYDIVVNGTQESALRSVLVEMFPGSTWHICEAYTSKTTET